MNSQQSRATTHLQRYQQPTCLLEVWTNYAAMSQWSDRPIASNLRFRLQVGNRTVKGNQQQLATTIETVVNYVDRSLANDSGYTLNHNLVLPKLKQLNLSTLQLFDLVANLEQCTNELTLLPSLDLELKRVTPNWLKVAAVLVAAIGVSLGTVRLITPQFSPQLARQDETTVATSAPESNPDRSNDLDNSDAIAPAAPETTAKESTPLPSDPDDQPAETDAAAELPVTADEPTAKSSLENELNLDPVEPEAIESELDQLASLPELPEAQSPQSSARQDAATVPADQPTDLQRNETSLDDAPIDNSGANRNIKPNASPRAARKRTNSPASPPAKIAGQDRQDRNNPALPQPTAPPYPSASTPLPSVTTPGDSSSSNNNESKDEAVTGIAPSEQLESRQRNQEIQPGRLSQRSEPATIGRSNTNDLDGDVSATESFGDHNRGANIQIVTIALNGQSISNTEQTRLANSLQQHLRSQNLYNSDDFADYGNLNRSGTATFVITLQPGQPNQVRLDRSASSLVGDSNDLANPIERSLSTWNPPIEAIVGFSNSSKSVQIKLTLQIN
ncbi:hypothetical protein Pse7367_3129 [Thalassoporum mexicanum PCC 7367]|uniref:DUF4335 domain-containing protein n=1 Tax=Thalassoporum mexicanum TaxID=3457544 RepID=UPI00029FC107|nr:DUF4335 domain-containing protein [Pseudanabaena sp. PCC 7367]AFY71377.1 hypothetical protein Pse7367_3129 [Pseudanabaena sp. PCC 7367]